MHVNDNAESLTGGGQRAGVLVAGKDGGTGTADKFATSVRLMLPLARFDSAWIRDRLGCPESGNWTGCRWRHGAVYWPAAKRRLGLASNPNTGVSTSEALYVRIMDVRVLVLVQPPLDRFCRYEMRPERHA